MKHITDKNWITGSGNKIKFPELVVLLEEYISLGAKVFIGSDSFISSRQICFATAICLHGGEKGSRYFFFRDFTPKNHFANLVSRITEETRRSIEVACLLMDKHKINPKNIELHMDVSPFTAGNGTSKYSDMLKGYVQGYGVDFKLKPDAWASQTVADKHSK